MKYEIYLQRSTTLSNNREVAASHDEYDKIELEFFSLLSRLLGLPQQHAFILEIGECNHGIVVIRTSIYFDRRPINGEGCRSPSDMGFGMDRPRVGREERITIATESVKQFQTEFLPGLSPFKVEEWLSDFFEKIQF